MKKITVLFLAVLMCVLPLAACGKKDKTPSSGNTTTPGQTTEKRDEETEAPYYLDTLDRDLYSDFDSIRIATIDSNIVLDQMPEDADEVDQKKYDRDFYLEEKFEMEINYTEIKNGVDSEEAKWMLNLVQSNMDAVDIFIQQPDNLLFLAINGAGENLRDIDTLNLDKIWWSQSMNENLVFNGAQYVVSGPVAEWFYGAVLALAYNKKMANDFAIGDLYETIFAGEWTLEAMQEICTNESIVDVEKGHYAMSFAQGVGPYGFFPSAGGKFCTVSEENGIEVNLNSQENIDLLEKITAACNSTKMFKDSVKKTAECFTSGNAFFYFSSVGWMENYLPMSEIDYGIIPCPKKDTTQEKYISCAWPSSSCSASIPSGMTAEKTEWAGLVLEAYCFLGYEMIKPIKYDALVKYQVALDENSSRMLDIIFDNMYYDINLVANLGTSRTAIGTAITQGADGFMGSYMGIKNLIDKDIQKYSSLTKRDEA